MMKWTRNEYKVGQTRERTAFLILPRCIDGLCRWMEWAVWQERLIEYAEFDGFGVVPRLMWLPTKWLDRTGDLYYAESDE